MDRKATVNTSSICTGFILGVVFLVLKLCGVIHWSWLWVLSPFWIPFVLVILLTIIYGIILYIGYKQSKNE